MTYADCAVRGLNEMGFDAYTENGKVYMNVWNADLADKFTFEISEEEMLLHGKKYAERMQREVTMQEWEMVELTCNPANKDSVCFETYGDDAEIIAKMIAENRVVTLMDDNDGNGEYIHFGYRKVNALCYYVTERSLDFVGDDIFECGTIKDMTGMQTIYFKEAKDV